MSQQRRPHADVERERRLILVVLAAKGKEGATAAELAHDLGADEKQVRNRLVTLETQGMVGRRTERRLERGRWLALFVRSEYLQDDPPLDGSQT